MKNRPLITIIVPVYNIENYLHQCIDSLLAQTYSNLEIILVDDGSKDNSGKICDDYAFVDSRIRVIHKSNGGLSDARNIGLSLAMGEYIGFVDSDDWIDPDMYELLLNSAIETGSYITVCGYYREYVNQKLECCSKKKVYTQEEALSKLLVNIELQSHAVTKLYRKFLWDNIEFPVGKFYEDVLTTYKLFLRTNSVSVIDKCCYHYRQRIGSITNNFECKKENLLEAVYRYKSELALYSKYKSEIDFRILQVKYTLLWELMMSGDRQLILKNKSDIEEWSNEIRKKKHLVLEWSSTQSILKIMALCPFFNYQVIRFFFILKRYKHMQKEAFK